MVTLAIAYHGKSQYERIYLPSGLLSFKTWKKNKGGEQFWMNNCVAIRYLLRYLVSGINFVGSKFGVKYLSGGVVTVGVLLA